MKETLELACRAARAAGERLRAEFHRPGGPRGAGGHAEVDEEAETEIRDTLLGAFPNWSFRGEETGVRVGDDQSRWWVVDPNDGTSDFVRGFRGSAVSIALVRMGEPVLGVVYSPLYPDASGDFFSWALGRGAPIRNGRAFHRLWPGALSPREVVLVSRAADRSTEANLNWLAPARIRPMASIAYRLALTAAGEACAATSLQHLQAHDFAAGDALLRAVGGALLDQEGTRPTYSYQSESRAPGCMAGDASICSELCARDWHTVFGGRRLRDEGLPFPVLPSPGRAVADARLLSRAQGCLLGQLSGDSLGGLVEFCRPEQVRGRYPDGPRELEDGGRWNILAGQPTDDSEMALALARSLIKWGGYEGRKALGAYRRWLDSKPFDLGLTTRRGLAGVPSVESQANGSLMRCSPLALASWSEPARLRSWAREDSSLTHAHPLCVSSCEAFLTAIAAGLAGADPDGMLMAAEAVASPEVADLLREARREPPRDYQTHMGWVRIAFQNAFYQLLQGSSLEEAVVETVRCGGDTDTNAAIAGALLGAAYGREAIPLQWRLAILSCRPSFAFKASVRPRPAFCWPCDLMEIAEALLLLDPSENRSEGQLGVAPKDR
ncbi:MAG: ADP-ribosylglycohydrolase family protein [Armatimonadetes bacterium]|nr:ADP-ribosylglycohydrolase family protein [Armatimonadota bacterium]